jgi:hypothetical protein
VWRRENNVILPDMSAEGTVRGVDSETASRDDSPETKGGIQDHVVPWDFVITHRTRDTLHDQVRRGIIGRMWTDLW